jgi:hypothetical protein
MGRFCKEQVGPTEAVARFLLWLEERTGTEVQDWLRLLVIARLGGQLYAGDRTVSRHTCHVFIELHTAPWFTTGHWAKYSVDEHSSNRNGVPEQTQQLTQFEEGGEKLQ